MRRKLPFQQPLRKRQCRDTVKLKTHTFDFDCSQSQRLGLILDETEFGHVLAGIYQSSMASNYPTLRLMIRSHMIISIRVGRKIMRPDNLNEIHDILCSAITDSKNIRLEF